ncbi:HD domain-containing phosphohydrolase, partial [Candidatus Oleimmundimicrobium sp.]|uniref:HD-GYP domain-containing protein n=1 Tax=Candidatus Oleimmundimicrobium sp. TaxID=3060597 RepID=UPI002717A32B|nr:two-component system response regulator [Candidatus Oleimmundimicrobium sp.]
YPSGLSKDKIPLGASIIKVADAFDAMTSDRPYRKAFSKEKAISELKRYKGIQFHPEVVETFLRVYEKIK